MINSKTILAIITARKGSTRLRDKNLLELNEKPLILWTVEEAIKSNYIDKIVLSTDHKKIIDLVKEYNDIEIPFVRPKELSNDTASSVDVIKHALNYYKELGLSFDYVMLLQPTSPLRIKEDIDNSIKQLSNEFKSVVSVCETDHSPLWCNKLPKNKSMKNFLSNSIKNLRSQELPIYYRLNGAVYISEVEYFLNSNGFFGDKTKAYIMPQERSIDIDSKLDMIIAESIFKSK